MKGNKSQWFYSDFFEMFCKHIYVNRWSIYFKTGLSVKLSDRQMIRYNSISMYLKNYSMIFSVCYIYIVVKMPVTIYANRLKIETILC